MDGGMDVGCGTLEPTSSCTEKFECFACGREIYCNAQVIDQVSEIEGKKAVVCAACLTGLMAVAGDREGFEVRDA